MQIRSVMWVAALALVACGGGSSGTGSRTQPPPSVGELSMSPPAPWRNGVVKFSTQCAGAGTLSYVWDMGDGTRPLTTSAPTIDYVYPTPQNYTVSVVCRDGTQASAPVALRFAVSSINLNSVAGRTCSSEALGQGWCVQNPLPTSTTLRSGVEVARATVWAVGDNGVIIKSTGGGLSWKAQFSGVTHGLKSISAHNASVAWAVGDAGALLKTTNGGETWVLSTPGRIAINLRAVSAVDAQQVWVANEIEIYKSLDGGTTWALQYDQMGVGSMKATPSGAVWASDTFAGLRRSVDGGKTWPAVVVPWSLRIVSFAAVSADVAWVLVDGGRVYLTTNGGQSWLARTLPVASGNTFTSISATDASSAWVLGAGASGDVVWATANGGSTWQQRTAYAGYKLTALAVESAERAWAVGQSGTVVQTIDAWASNVVHSSGTTQALGGVAAGDDQTAWVVEGGAPLLKTIDGGLSWQRQTMPAWATAVKAVDARTAWAVGWDGELLRTTDGVRWDRAARGQVFETLAPLDHELLWGLGGGQVLRSIDGGENWSAFAAPTTLDTPTPHHLTDVAAASADTAWVATKLFPRPTIANEAIGRIFKTSDGGANWVAQLASTEHSFVRVVAIDANTAWALASSSVFGPAPRAHNAVYLTTNGGAVWVEKMRLSNVSTTYPNGVLYAISAQSAQRAQVVGTGGRYGASIYETLDGGTTWVPQAARFPSATLLDISWARASPAASPAASATTAWAVGHDGLILKTLTAGR